MMEILVLQVIVKKLLLKKLNYLEGHKFEEIRTLFWRNSNLNFNNPLSLIKSLEEKPNRDGYEKFMNVKMKKLLNIF